MSLFGHPGLLASQAKHINSKVNFFENFQGFFTPKDAATLRIISLNTWGMPHTLGAQAGFHATLFKLFKIF
jgi:hypothetical protein